ncbi:hypothetical protein PINS_up010680 [Pythium insidiosum]|nr:hypothetical protein PINS_up010680 [Pythium insidiosum]
MKKRSNSFSVEVVEPKRRTPRRLYPTGSPRFDDDLSSSFSSTSSHSFSSVGTPTNFSSAEISRMWGPELDFPGGYVDTFLDLPTPKCAEMPTVSSHDKKSSNKSVGDDLEQPKLVRTTSIEQEGLSQFLEQTTLESESPPPREAPTPSSSRQSNNALRRATPTAGYSRQAQVAVDDYFGKMLPSPAPQSISGCARPRANASDATTWRIQF